MADKRKPSITREHIGVGMMVVGYLSLVVGIAVISPAWATIIGGALLLTAGVAIDRMS